MYVVIISSLIAFLLTYFESKGKMRNGMLVGFVLITIIGAIHYNYGSDYMSYLYGYELLTNCEFNLNVIFENKIFKDPGWGILCWLFKPIGGFFMMVAVLNIVQNYIVYNFIKKNVQKLWWPLAIFVYLFNTSFYLLSFSMMRQMFVITVFLALWSFIKNRKWLWPLIVLYLCSFIHGSALILIPFVFWGYLPPKFKIIGILYPCILIVLYLFDYIISDIILFFESNNERIGDYINTYKNDEVINKYGIGFIINMIPFVLSLNFLLNKNNDVMLKRLVALSSISYLLYPFMNVIHLFSRISIYFKIYTIASIPLIYANIKRKELQLCLLILYIFITLFDYFNFYNQDIWKQSYSTFHTIFNLL